MTTAELRAWGDLKEGTELDTQDFGPLTRTDFVRYQGASGDMNPIHHDETFAKSAGFPSVFSVGMLQAGILGTYCTDRLGPQNVRKFGFQFREQVWPGDVLTCHAKVVKRHEQDGERRIDLDLKVTRQTGGEAILGHATFVVE